MIVPVRMCKELDIKIKRTVVSMALDTGATGSMISLDLSKVANLDVYHTTQRAILADGVATLLW